MVSPGKSVIEEDAEIPDGVGDRYAKLRVGRAEVEVGERGAVQVRGPVRGGEGDELHFFRGDPEAVSGKPARHVLEALGGQGSSVSTHASGGDNSSIIDVHVDIASECLL